uniref:Uncharacterized protein n=1 Tax=Tanacetum cinerariifolium TaxID=118510 RepID=A0A699HAJ8_TANCI|nr:hypothetical protein [Tanacetum cinerariifolium]
MIKRCFEMVLLFSFQCRRLLGLLCLLPGEDCHVTIANASCTTCVVLDPAQVIVMDTLFLLSSSDGEGIIVSLVPITHHVNLDDGLITHPIHILNGSAPHVDHSGVLWVGYEMKDVVDNVGDVSLEDIIASVELVGNEDHVP